VPAAAQHAATPWRADLAVLARELQDALSSLPLPVRSTCMPSTSVRALLWTHPSQARKSTSPTALTSTWGGIPVQQSHQEVRSVRQPYFCTDANSAVTIVALVAKLSAT